jgi:hypothetical protein
VVAMKSAVFWHVTPCSSVGNHLHFRGLLTLKMKVSYSSETWVYICHVIQDLVKPRCKFGGGGNPLHTLSAGYLMNKNLQDLRSNSIGPWNKKYAVNVETLNWDITLLLDWCKWHLSFCVSVLSVCMISSPQYLWVEIMKSPTTSMV